MRCSFRQVLLSKLLLRFYASFKHVDLVFKLHFELLVLLINATEANIQVINLLYFPL